MDERYLHLQLKKSSFPWSGPPGLGVLGSMVPSLTLDPCL